VTDQLILNAGVGVGVYNETPDHLDSHFQVNHLSQFHLLLKLLPILQRTPNSRLVLESSDLHRGATDDVQFASEAEINRDIGPVKLYNRTKLAQVLTVRALQRRQEAGQLGFAPGNKVYINAVHPGGVETDQPKQAEEAYGKPGVIGHTLIKPFLKDPVESGCRSALFAATGERVVAEEISGCYIVPDAKVTEPSKAAKDDALGGRLWELSEKILRDRLG
jgi:WW domain-containing oxidoreductase